MFDIQPTLGEFTAVMQRAEIAEARLADWKATAIIEMNAHRLEIEADDFKIRDLRAEVERLKGGLKEVERGQGVPYSRIEAMNAEIVAEAKRHKAIEENFVREYGAIESDRDALQAKAHELERALEIIEAQSEPDKPTSKATCMAAIAQQAIIGHLGDEVNEALLKFRGEKP